jgi:hypothetical protein
MGLSLLGRNGLKSENKNNINSAKTVGGLARISTSQAAREGPAELDSFQNKALTSPEPAAILIA